MSSPPQDPSPIAQALADELGEIIPQTIFDPLPSPLVVFSTNQPIGQIILDKNAVIAGGAASLPAEPQPIGLIERWVTQTVDIIEAVVNRKVDLTELPRVVREVVASHDNPNITNPLQLFCDFLTQLKDEVQSDELRQQLLNDLQQLDDLFGVAGYESEGAPSETLPSYHSRCSSIEATGIPNVDAGPDPSPIGDGPWYDKLPAADRVMNINYMHDARAPLLQEPVFKAKGFNEEDFDLPEDVPRTLSKAQYSAVSDKTELGDRIHCLPGMERRQMVPQPVLTDDDHDIVPRGLPVVITCNEQPFYVNECLLSKSSVRWESYISYLRSKEPRRPNGTFKIIREKLEVLDEVFKVLIDALMLPGGLRGDEKTLSLVQILAAMSLAQAWEMDRVLRKLALSAKRYIALTILKYNPWKPLEQTSADVAQNGFGTTPPPDFLDDKYFVYRSEELYRAWKLVKDAPVLEIAVTVRQLMELYVLAVPEDMWPALTVDFDQDFFIHINQCRAQRAVDPEIDFEDWQADFRAAAGCEVGMEPRNLSSPDDALAWLGLA